MCSNWTIIVVTSPMPSNPDCSKGMQCLDSLKNLGLDSSPIILAADHPRDVKDMSKRSKKWGKSNSKEIRNYNRFITILESDPRITRVNRLKRWGHMSGNVEGAMRLVETKYVLVIEHDVALVERQPISLETLETALDAPEVDAILFRPRKSSSKNPCAVRPNLRPDNVLNVLNIKTKSDKWRVCPSHPEFPFLRMTAKKEWSNRVYATTKSKWIRNVYGRLIKSKRCPNNRCSPEEGFYFKDSSIEKPNSWFVAHPKPLHIHLDGADRLKESRLMLCGNRII